MAQDTPLGCEAPMNRWGQSVILLGGGLALVAVVLLLSAGTGSRFGLWHFRTGFTLLQYAAYVGGIAVLVNGAGIFLAAGMRRKHFLLLAIAGLAAALFAVAVPLYWKTTAGRLPRIHDITTDTVNPPVFVALLSQRAGAANPPEYGGADIAANQHQAYPDIKPLVVNLSLDQAMARAAVIARELGWRIVAEVPGEGRIEATDTTRWFGFTDDIVIRITPAGARSVVDIRSVSRVGISDVGTNARRIRTFLKKLEQ